MNYYYYYFSLVKILGFSSITCMNSLKLLKEGGTGLINFAGMLIIFWLFLETMLSLKLSL